MLPRVRITTRHAQASLFRRKRADAVADRRTLVEAARRVFGVVRDPDAERIRTVTFGWLFALGFALLGLARYVPGAGLLGESPFELDQALRTVTAGWFAPERTRPVTLVDIDVATYAAWHAPLVTPRGDLERLLRTVTAAQPLAVIVDVDLSSDPDAPPPSADLAGDSTLRDFLRAYQGAAPIIFPAVTSRCRRHRRSAVTQSQAHL